MSWPEASEMVQVVAFETFAVKVIVPPSGGTTLGETLKPEIARAVDDR
jgi:hypothetical protein